MTGGLFYDEHVGGEAMADVVKPEWFGAGAVVPVSADATTALVAEIERLRAELVAAKEEATDFHDAAVSNARERNRLRAERDRLRDALRAIARSGVYSWAEGKAIESPDGDRHEIAIAAARAALGEDAT